MTRSRGLSGWALGAQLWREGNGTSWTVMLDPEERRVPAWLAGGATVRWRTQELLAAISAPDARTPTGGSAVSPRGWGTRPTEDVSPRPTLDDCHWFPVTFVWHPGVQRVAEPRPEHHERGAYFRSLNRGPRGLPNQVGWAPVVAQLLPARPGRDSRAPSAWGCRPRPGGGPHGSSAVAFLGVLTISPPLA